MKLLAPNDILQALRKQYARHHRTWLAGFAQWPLEYPLGTVTERDVVCDVTAIRDWVTAWENYALGGTLTWVTRQWPRLGTHRLPERICFDNPSIVASLIGESLRWETAQSRYIQMCKIWPALKNGPALSRHFDELADYSFADFNRLLALLTWLEANPNSNRYVRQLPIEGLDTKWIGGGSRRGLVTELIRTIRDVPDGVDFYETCGLRKPPARMRLRILCPQLRAQIGGLIDVEAPLEEIAGLAFSPRAILIVENLETGLALPDLPGVAVFMRLGNAVSLLAEIPWIKSIDILYWGDIDTFGYAILARARSILPQIRSILMDEATLEGHRLLWVEEAQQTKAADCIYLTPAELRVYTELLKQTWGFNVRLEQERIIWLEAMDALTKALYPA